MHDHLAKAEPVQALNPQGAALARLFQLPEADAATAATWQQFAAAVIVELLIVGSFDVSYWHRADSSRSATSPSAVVGYSRRGYQALVTGKDGAPGNLAKDRR